MLGSAVTFILLSASVYFRKSDITLSRTRHPDTKDLTKNRSEKPPLKEFVVYKVKRCKNSSISMKKNLLERKVAETTRNRNPEWRKEKSLLHLLQLGHGTHYIDKNAKCQLKQNTKYTGKPFWEELTDTPEGCCNKCLKRHECFMFNHRGYVCNMFHRLDKGGLKTEGGVVSGAVTGGFEVPFDCRTKGKHCSCPKSTWALNLAFDKFPTRASACSKLPSTMLFAGDSLIRDMWTTLGIWLLVLDGIDAVEAAAFNHRAACMANAWKYLDYLGMTDLMKQKKVLVDENGYRTISVCGGKTKLLFQSANQFGDLSGLSKSMNSRTSKIDIFIIGGGIHNMVRHGDNEKPLVSWLSRISSLKDKNTIDQIIVVGTHYRIIELAPKPYRRYAKGPQGNKKILRWNEIMKQNSGEYTFVNPYNITSSLTESYEDTEDGMHMGFWINLQKVFLVFKSLLVDH